MSGNTFGKLFCVTSFGESHGPAIGCVVDGCPPGLEISTEEIQLELDRRILDERAKRLSSELDKLQRQLVKQRL